jgi:hypothetical protein
VPVTIVLSVAVGYLFLSAVSIPFRSPLAGPSTGATSPAAAHRHSRPATAARHREPGRHGLASLAGPPIVVTGHRRRRLPPGFPLPGPPPGCGPARRVPGPVAACCADGRRAARNIRRPARVTLKWRRHWPS